ncbi:transposase family protein [Mycobacterium avium]|uniref:transposase family protein n=1 Tax=Mycobacterium avium TaxID=1764 RepID=UPI0035282B15
MGLMQPQSTDTDPLPHRWRNLLPLTGLTRAQVQAVCTTTTDQRLPPHSGRPWGLPLAARVLLVLIHLRTNLTTRALAALFSTSQSNRQSTASSITWYRCWPARCDPPRTTAHTRGSSMAR